MPKFITNKKRQRKYYYDNPFSKRNNTIDAVGKKEKRKTFRDLIKRKYKIIDDRLYYIYALYKNKLITVFIFAFL